MSDSQPPDVIGALPRSRPHRRSTKRAPRVPQVAPAVAKPTLAAPAPGPKSVVTPDPRVLAAQAAAERAVSDQVRAARAGAHPAELLALPLELAAPAVKLASDVAEAGFATGARLLRKLPGI